MSIDAPYGRIAAAIDGGRHDEAVLALARRLATLGEGANLALVHVATVPPPVGLDPAYSSWLGLGVTVDATPFLDAGRALLEASANPDAGEVTVLLEGYPPEAVCEFAEQQRLDLLVVGGHQGRLASLGGFASYVSHNAPCAVIVVPADGAD